MAKRLLVAAPLLFLPKITAASDVDSETCILYSEKNYQGSYSTHKLDRAQGHWNLHLLSGQGDEYRVGSFKCGDKLEYKLCKTVGEDCHS